MPTILPPFCFIPHLSLTPPFLPPSLPPSVRSPNQQHLRSAYHPPPPLLRHFRRCRLCCSRGWFEGGREGGRAKRSGTHMYLLTPLPPSLPPSTGHPPAPSRPSSQLLPLPHLGPRHTVRSLPPSLPSSLPPSRSSTYSSLSPSLLPSLPAVSSKNALGSTSASVISSRSTHPSHPCVPPSLPPSLQ